MQSTFCCTQISKRIYCFLYGCIILLSFSCKQEQRSQPMFKALNAKKTGIDFVNKLHPSSLLNLFTYMYYYNGAGIGAGDFNNDGKIDLFFTSNQGKNELFLNDGNMHFTNVTTQANIPNDASWSTGVSVIDINNDGLLDIYICKVSGFDSLKGKNQLLVCKGIRNGVPYYEDEAKQYGLDFSGYCTQAVFFDYDGDGDLDMFLLNHAVSNEGHYAPRKMFLNTYDAKAGDRIFRNNGNNTFTDVTHQTGINSNAISYGLGVCVSDIDNDGWPDIYVGNDFHENDYLYINRHNGTFKDESTQQLAHTSKYTMGVDVADAGNDGYPDIISLDMMAYDPTVLKQSLGEDNYEVFNLKNSFGYSYQYARNNLQYNRRNGHFSEIGYYAGVYATDWSWAPLWVDFDNDGKKDLFISNGIPKRMNDMDYVNFVSGNEIQEKLRDNKLEEKDMALVDKFPVIKIPNKFYLNRGQMKFQDIAENIQNDEPAFSNGAIYADLDNDGDADLVVNNIDTTPIIYENLLNNRKSAKNSATVTLKGSKKNINAIGAKIYLFTKNEIRSYENFPVHGFQSSMQAPLLIGLSNTVVDSAFVVWSDNTYQKIKLQSGANTFTYSNGLPAFDYNRISGFNKSGFTNITDITDSVGLKYTHQENEFNQFDRDPLLARMTSAEGPALAVADINGDGLEDVFVGASRGYHNAVFLQTSKGTFTKTSQPDLDKDSLYENVNAVWADVNGDKFIDLIVANGGDEYKSPSPYLSPALYLNDGKGNLKKVNNAFDEIQCTQSVIVPLDFNHDGYTDLFIGGRVVPWEYGTMPRSYLLQNDGKGHFTDVTQKIAPELVYAGMVTGAAYTDLNGDKKSELVICYEWGGIDAFTYDGGKWTKKQITDKNGWWNFVFPCDINHDGLTDLVAGNLGLNTLFNPTANNPVKMYYNDFGNIGEKEPVITYYLGGKEIPLATKMDIEKELPAIKKKYLYAADFSHADITDLFGHDKIDDAQKFSADYFANAILINKGNFKFEIQPLPYEAQFTCYKAVAAIPNANGFPDLLLGGNYSYNNMQIGRQDADLGTILINDGKGNFRYTMANPVISGDVRNILPIEIKGQQAYIIAKNNGSLQVIKLKNR